MWRPLKAIVLTAASVVAVPFAVALLANILYGWPLGPRRYHRAFHPVKVLAMNYAILREFTKIRYLGLALRWRQFYLNAQRNQLIRDLPYGSNSNLVDVYLPSTRTSGLRPVVVFIYGGTWGSGDKNMYGLLCSELANTLSSVVLCPNYSLYPKGFVDDMVQDISDVIAFIHQRAVEFHGDKNNVVLIGHSAGAHLAVLTVIELTLKRLTEAKSSDSTELNNQSDDVTSRQFTISCVSATDYFNDMPQVGYISTEDYDQSTSHTIVDQSESVNAIIDESETVNAIADQSAVSEESAESLDSTDQIEIINEPVDETAMSSFYMVDDNPGDSDNVSKQLEVDKSDSKPTEKQLDEQLEVPLDTSQQLMNTDSITDGHSDLLSSVKLVIGLAGVYDINVHYEYEAWRGVEDISTMARAMYGPNHFDRFSPTVIIQSLPPTTRLPAIHLIHGNIDSTVPESQSRLFGQTVFDHTVGCVSETIVVGCGHADVCVDLMDSGRQWHHTVKSDISRVFQRLFNN